jgi:pyrroloquinoline quinone (PQQ) biosynthesis protein C
MLKNMDAVIDEAITGRRLLAHPFYRRWVEGTLERAELATYAGQYRHFEAALPVVLEEITRRIDDPTARQLVEANLDDERGAPAPHLHMFDDFGRAVGADLGAGPEAATQDLVNLYRSLATTSPVGALAAVAAYEVQAPGIASSKADGLRARYGLDARATRFWDVHAAVDEMHGRWILDALARCAGDGSSEDARDAADAAAGAWWAFLDERELARPMHAAC